MDVLRTLDILKWNILTHKSELWRNCCAWIVGVVIASIFSSGVIFHRHEVTTAEYFPICMFYVMVVSVAMLKYASGVCFNMKTKGDYINFAMLPATKLEKLTANVLYVTVVMMCCIVVGTLVGDAIQALITKLLTNTCVSMTSIILNNCLELPVNSHDEYYSLAVLIFVLGGIATHATFILGGTVFRRHPMLLTCLCWLGFFSTIITLLISIVTTLTEIMIEEGYSFAFNLGEVPPYTMNIITIVFYGVVITCTYYLAYRFFKRSQLINNSWIN